MRVRVIAIVLGAALMLCARAVRAADAPASSAPSAPSSQPSSQPVVVIDASDKAAIDGSMGKDVIVEGVVDAAAWSKTGKVLSLEFKGASETRFQAVAFEKRKEDLNKAFSGDFAKNIAGARVRIRGKLKDYHGRPEITIDKANQVTVIEPAPPPKT